MYQVVLYCSTVFFCFILAVLFSDFWKLNLDYYLYLLTLNQSWGNQNNRKRRRTTTTTSKKNLVTNNEKKLERNKHKKAIYWKRTSTETEQLTERAREKEVEWIILEYVAQTIEFHETTRWTVCLAVTLKSINIFDRIFLLDEYTQQQNEQQQKGKKHTHTQLDERMNERIKMQNFTKK